MIIIPATVLNVGYSPGSMIQLSMAPNIGLISLHILISLTLAPLLYKAINQKLKAKTEINTRIERLI